MEEGAKSCAYTHDRLHISKKNGQGDFFVYLQTLSQLNKLDGLVAGLRLSCFVSLLNEVSLTPYAPSSNRDACAYL
jgi:hypothetical protein